MLDAVAVLAMPVTEFTCKVQMGQHLADKAKVTVYEKLLERAGPGDLDCARAMRELYCDLLG